MRKPRSAFLTPKGSTGRFRHNSPSKRQRDTGSDTGRAARRASFPPCSTCSRVWARRGTQALHQPTCLRRRDVFLQNAGRRGWTCCLMEARRPRYRPTARPASHRSRHRAAHLLICLICERARPRADRDRSCGAGGRPGADAQDRAGPALAHAFQRAAQRCATDPAGASKAWQGGATVAVAAPKGGRLSGGVGRSGRNGLMSSGWCVVDRVASARLSGLRRASAAVCCRHARASWAEQASPSSSHGPLTGRQHRRQHVRTRPHSFVCASWRRRGLSTTGTGGDDRQGTLGGTHRQRTVTRTKTGRQASIPGKEEACERA